MFIEDVLALLDEDRPAGWVSYEDGSWSPISPGGRVEPPITAGDLIEAARRDLAALEAAGLIATVIDTEPLSVVDIEYGPRGGRGSRPALDCGPANRLLRRNQSE
ncbi:hypothetical protein [Nocardia tengchongensis]|uniref:hypothetical protein n=1 Tax=Nocardia tengchongensis TaxID=2055889 RepID=UPI0036BAFCE0